MVRFAKRLLHSFTLLGAAATVAIQPDKTPVLAEVHPSGSLNLPRPSPVLFYNIFTFWISLLNGSSFPWGKKALFDQWLFWNLELMVITTKANACEKLLCKMMPTFSLINIQLVSSKKIKHYPPWQSHVLFWFFALAHVGLTGVIGKVLALLLLVLFFYCVSNKILIFIGSFCLLSIRGWKSSISL